MNKSRVFLVGAGPGDPDLLTLKAKQVLEEADVVLYDHLVHTNCFLFCKPNAQLICVGKSKGKHSQTQDEIHKLFEYHAKKEQLIVRLKGGDSLIFGRGGEEMAFLKSKNIPYEVVPGVSAGMAVPAYAGIPLTHREWSRSVAFVTGTTTKGESLSKIQYPKADTLVFFMAVSQLKELSKTIQETNQLDKNTPAALIYRGTTSQQKVAYGTLETINQIKEQKGIEAPALLVVGKVASLTNELSWTHHLPLIGKRFVVLREKNQAKELIVNLSRLGAEVVHSPLLEFCPIKSNIHKINKKTLKKTKKILFTSSNGVRFFIKALFSQGIDLRALNGVEIIAIGQKTSDALKEKGLIVDRVPQTFNSDGLIEELKKESLEKVNILIPTAKKARNKLIKNLEGLGANVTRVDLYETNRPQDVKLEVKNNDTVIFMSPSSAEFFFESKLYSNQPIHAICIGDTTKNKVSHYLKNNIISSEKETIESIMTCILNRLGKETS